MLSMNFWFFAFTIILMVLVAFVGFFAKQMENDEDETFYHERYSSAKEDIMELKHQIWLLERTNESLMEELSKLKTLEK